MRAKAVTADRILTALANELKRDVSTIGLNHSLRGDLGLNSLDAIELMFRIEEEFDLSIPDDDIQGLVKVGDVIEYLERRLAPAAPAPRATPAAAPPRPTPAAKAPANKAKAQASRRHA